MSNIETVLNDIIKEQGGNAADSVAEIVVQLIKSQCKEEYEAISVIRCNELDVDTPEVLRDQILGKYFTSEQKYKKIKHIEDRFDLIGMASGIIDIAINVKEIYDYTENYLIDQTHKPDQALSIAFGTLSNILGMIKGCEYVSGILSVGKDVLDVASAMVNNYVAQYEQLEAMIDGVEESGVVNESDATYITGVYKEITQLANSGDIEVMNFAYGMLNDYGWFFDLCGADISSRVDVIAFKSS